MLNFLNALSVLILVVRYWLTREFPDESWGIFILTYYFATFNL